MKSKITGRFIRKYIVTGAVFTLLVIGLAVGAVILCHTRIWYGDDPTYIFLKMIDQNKWQIGIGFVGIGWIIIACFFMVKWIGYIGEIALASEKLADLSEDTIILHDDLKEIQDQLNELRKKAIKNARVAKEAEQRKNDLIVYLAHDLKTPLTSVIGYLTLLSEEPDIPAKTRAKYVGITLRKAERLEELINEFFDITRYNLQNIELEPVEIDLTMMLEQLADELYGVLQEKKLTCEVDVEEDLMIYGDPDKLARVFDNILRNAIAYCYANTEIRIEAKIKDGDIEITFTNAGDKIPGDMLQTIFEKFYRVDGSRSTGTGGAGLGLAIAKQIVELHGGRILAKSDDNQTQFVVTLPSKEKTEQKEGSKDEVHTHRRLAFRGKTGRGKRLQSK